MLASGKINILYFLQFNELKLNIHGLARNYNFIWIISWHTIIKILINLEYDMFLKKYKLHTNGKDGTIMIESRLAISDLS